MSEYDMSVINEDKFCGEAFRIHEKNIDLFLRQLKERMLNCENFRYTHEAIVVKKDNGNYESPCVETLIRFTNQP